MENVRILRKGRVNVDSSTMHLVLAHEFGGQFRLYMKHTVFYKGHVSGVEVHLEFPSLFEDCIISSSIQNMFKRIQRYVLFTDQTSECLLVFPFLKVKIVEFITKHQLS